MATTQRWAAVLVAAMVLLTGCNSIRQASNTDVLMKPQAPTGNGIAADESAPGAAQVAPGRAAKEAAPQPPAGGATANTSENAPPATAGQYIIRRAAVTIQAKDVRQAMQHISDSVRVVGGFVSDSSLDATEGQAPMAKLTLRVPAEKFDDVLNSLGGAGTVRSRQVTSEDVTMAYVDTDSRIRNLKQEETQLLALLNRSGKLGDILTVERELTRVRGEIESAEGELRHMAHQVALATIDVTISEPVQVSASSPWQLPVVWQNAWQNTEAELAGAISGLVAGFVWWVGYALPLGLPLLLIYLMVGWGLRRWLVDRQGVLSLVTFRRIWWALGLGLVAIAYPPLLAIAITVAFLLALIWGASVLWGRLRGPSPQV